MISVDDISRISEKRNRLRKETYVKIYEQISKKIRQSVELSHKHVFVQIPSFVIGHPHFDRTKATNYIVRQLHIGGFMVQHVGEFELCISWRPKKVKKQEVADKEEDFEDFPTLINLKKTANKYRAAR
ncbi:MAG: hypothetical protein Ct9H90mV1_0550 [Prasinovirus sp.]|nr:MAG: hypothetical protein Ct9H90mV1_0550 [Prasinovirus sp.]|tara:strand:+ start:2061 stop:2444 length:384 start_codon:yes stop_codon:yes gene_type:complete